jgi:nicotinate-nucleotide pyrophosphorylase (carboxylating)
MPQPKLDWDAVDRIIELALREDIGPGDVTTRHLIPPHARAAADLVAREPGVLAGMPVVCRLLKSFDPKLKLYKALQDGTALEKGTVIAELRGPSAAMLTIERTLLNFLQRLSGIATLTARYVAAVEGTGAAILDTRKTLPGWRSLSKYAVAVGGGRNHRVGLHDQVMIKDNHVAAFRAAVGEPVTPTESMCVLISRLPHQASGRRTAPYRGMLIEVETETVEEAVDASSGADIVMLDNMSLARMRKAVVAIRSGSRGHPIIEASGGITLRNVRRVAETGVDWISVGALTHSARALDIALDFRPTRRRPVRKTV